MKLFLGLLLSMPVGLGAMTTSGSGTDAPSRDKLIEQLGKYGSDYTMLTLEQLQELFGTARELDGSISWKTRKDDKEIQALERKIYDAVLTKFKGDKKAAKAALFGVADDYSDDETDLQKEPTIDIVYANAKRKTAAIGGMQDRKKLNDGEITRLKSEEEAKALLIAKIEADLKSEQGKQADLKKRHAALEEDQSTLDVAIGIGEQMRSKNADFVKEMKAAKEEEISKRVDAIEAKGIERLKLQQKQKKPGQADADFATRDAAFGTEISKLESENVTANAELAAIQKKLDAIDKPATYAGALGRWWNKNK